MELIAELWQWVREGVIWLRDHPIGKQVNLTAEQINTVKQGVTGNGNLSDKELGIRLERE